MRCALLCWEQVGFGTRPVLCMCEDGGGVSGVRLGTSGPVCAFCVVAPYSCDSRVTTGLQV